MNCKYVFLLTLLLTLEFSIDTFAQLKPDSYCYICCACVGTGNLLLKQDGTFHMEYTEYRSRNDKRGTTYVGRGKYQQEKNTLTLNFEDLPAITSAITLVKVAESDAIVIDIKRIFDPVDSVEIYGANVKIQSQDKKLQPLVWLNFGKDAENRLTYKPSQAMHVNPKLLFIESFYLGYGDASAPIPGPGHYTAEITHVYGDIWLGSKDQKTFDVEDTAEGVVIRDRSNQALVFTRKSCRCN